MVSDLKHLIEEARQAAAVAVNAGLTLLYWRIGQRIRVEVLNQTRASYGQEILPTLSAELTPHYGRGFSARSLWRMVQFAETFPDHAQVSKLSQRLAWSHFQELIGISDPLARDFYAEMCSIERWSVRTLRDRVNSMLFQRTALSKKPENLIRVELDALHAQGAVTPHVLLKDPYVLDFLDLQISLRGERFGRRHSSRTGKIPARTGRGLQRWRGSAASSSTMTISTSTCCSTTASCAVWWLWS